MTTNLNALVANERVADLSRSARSATGRSRIDAKYGSVGLRKAVPGDAANLRMLAALDEAEELTGDVLLASIEGEPVAAMSLDDGRVVADPFVATAGPVVLLRLRARQLAGRKPRRGLRRLRPRFA
jgi:hypothetical protein